MQKIDYVDDDFKPQYYMVPSQGDVVILIDNRGLRLPGAKLGDCFVVDKYCPQYGVPDKIRTMCGLYISYYRFKLAPYKIRIKQLY